MKDGFTSTNAQALRALADALEPLEALEADYKSVWDELNAHSRIPEARILGERSRFSQKVQALEEERKSIKKEISEIEERAAHYRRIGYNGGRFPTPGTKRQEARIMEIENEIESLQETMKEAIQAAGFTPDESRENYRLYNIAHNKRIEVEKALEAIRPVFEAAYSVIRKRAHIPALVHGITPYMLLEKRLREG